MLKELEGLSFISSCDSNKDNSPSSIVSFNAYNSGKTSKDAENFLFELVIIMHVSL